MPVRRITGSQRGSHMLYKNESLRYVVANMAGELEVLYADRKTIMKRIASIKSTLAGLVRLSDDPALAEQMECALALPGQRKNGLTQACRSILINSAAPVTAREVCARASDHVRHHIDPLASVTTILNRLVQYGEAELVNDSEPSRYVWQSTQNSAGSSVSR